MRRPSKKKQERVQHVLDVYKRHKRSLMVTGVVGVSIGTKGDDSSSGRRPKADDWAIIVYVKKKLSVAEVERLRRKVLPDEIEGVRVNVVEVDKEVRLAAKSKTVPLVGGLEMGLRRPNNTLHNVGTLGLVVEKAADDARAFLTCGHVAYEDVPWNQTGNTLVEPAVANSTNDIGTPGLHALAGDPKLDAALVESNGLRANHPARLSLCPGQKVSSLWEGDPGDLLLAPDVFKVGAKTGKRAGVLKSLTEPPRTFDRVGRLDHLISFVGVDKMFADVGDSGAIVVRELTPAKLQGVAIIVGVGSEAGVARRVYCQPLHMVYDGLGIKKP